MFKLFRRPVSLSSIRNDRTKSLPTATIETKVISAIEDWNSATRRVNQYTIKDMIGEGALSSVYMATDDSSEQYAIKEVSKNRLARMENNVISPLLSAANRDRTQLPASLRNEIDILKELRHPNIIRLLEVLETAEEDSVYLVFEYCSRGAIYQIPIYNNDEPAEVPIVNKATAKPLKLEQCWQLFRQVILAIHYLHNEKRIAHRDIKPENILLDSKGTVKLCDFSVSIRLNESVETYRNVNRSVGSPAFVAPELLNNAGVLDLFACDMWAAGVTLYSMVYAHLPFQGKSIMEMNAKIRGENGQEPKYDTLTPPELIDFMQRLMDRDVINRLKAQDAISHLWITKRGKKPLYQQSKGTTDNAVINKLHHTRSQSNNAVIEKSQLL